MIYLSSSDIFMYFINYFVSNFSWFRTSMERWRPNRKRLHEIHKYSFCDQYPSGNYSNVSDNTIILYLSSNFVFLIVFRTQALLINSLDNHFPYLKKSPHVHEVYVHNLLCILDYKPKLRPEIFRLLFSK